MVDHLGNGTKRWGWRVSRRGWTCDRAAGKERCGGQLRMVRSGLSGSVQIEEGSGEEMSLFTPF